MAPILGIWASSIQGSKATSFDSIATVTVGAGGSANVEFTSIPSTYTHLQIRYIARGTDSAQNNIGFTFNNDTAANYAQHLLYGDGTSAAATGGANGNQGTYLSLANSSRLASTFAAGVIDILDYKSTNKNKTVRYLGGREDNSAGIAIFSSNLWFKTPEAITSIKFAPVSSGNFAQYTHFALYGIKG